MRLSIVHLLMFLCLWFTYSKALPAQTVKTPKVIVNRILIPESEFNNYFKATENQKIRGFSFHELESLIEDDFKWYQHQEAISQKNTQAPPYSWSVLNSKLSAHQQGLELKFECEYVVETVRKGMFIIPLLGNGISLIEAVVNGEPARLVNQASHGKSSGEIFSVVVSSTQEKNTTHIIKATFLAPVETVDYYQKTSFHLLPSPSTYAQFTLENINLDVSLGEGLGVNHTEKAQSTVISGYLKPSPEFEITWFKMSQTNVSRKSAVDVQNGKKPATALANEVESLKKDLSNKSFEKKLWVESEFFQDIEIGEGRLTGMVNLHLEAFRTPLSSIVIKTMNEVHLDHLAVLSSADLIDTWEANEKDGTIKVFFRHPQEGKLSLWFTYYNDTRGKSSFKAAIPQFTVKESNRENGFIGIRRKTIVEISVLEKSESLEEIPLSMVPSQYINGNTSKSLLMYRYPSNPWNLSIEVKRFLDAGVVTTVIDHISASTMISANGSALSRIDYTLRSRTKAPLQIDIVPLGKESQIDELLLNGQETALSKTKDNKWEISLAPVKHLGAEDTIKVSLFCTHSIPSPSFWGTFSLSLPTVSSETKNVNWSVAAPRSHRCFGFFGNFGKRTATNVPFPLEGANDQLKKKYSQYNVERSLLPPDTKLTLTCSYINTSALELPFMILFVGGMLSGHGIIMILSGARRTPLYLGILLVLTVIFILFPAQLSSSLPFIVKGFLTYLVFIACYGMWLTGKGLRKWFKSRKDTPKEHLSPVDTNIARVHGEVEGGDDNE